MINRLDISWVTASLAGHDRSTAATRTAGVEATVPADGQYGHPQAGEGRQPSDEAQRQVQQLKKRDQEVRAHEQAHLSAGAGLVQGGASFTFERGPDGRMYAVGGEVKIDASPEIDPDQTIRKMQQVKRAALAPSEPSGADRAVAAQASQIEVQARQEKNRSEEATAGSEQAHDRPAAQSSGIESGWPGRRPYSTDDNGHALNISV